MRQEAICSNANSSKCFPRTSYLVYGLERLLHKAGGNSASASPWSEYKNDGKMVGKTDSIIKHSARCAWRISQGIIANCICVNCRFCHFVGLQKPTKTTIPTKLTSVMCSLVVQRLSSPHVQISRIFREQYSSEFSIHTMILLCDYYDITMLFKALHNTSKQNPLTAGAYCSPAE